MKARVTALPLGLLAGILLILGSGCTSLPSPGSRLDTQDLQNAIVTDHVEYVRAAVEARVASVNERVPAPVYEEGTPLITIAARAGSARVTAYLIAAGADLNARTPAGETALMLASYFPSEDSGPSGDGPSSSGNGSGPSADAHAKVARMLVEAGATLENEPHNYTPLAYAAYQGRDEMIRYLLARGARVNPDGNNGYAYINTPLMMAAIQGHTSTAVLLLRAGADPRVRIVNGHTAAELAAKHQQGQAMVSLLKCAESSDSGEVFRRRCDNPR